MPIQTITVFAPTDNPDWSLNEGSMYNVSGTSTMGASTSVDILDDDLLLSDSQNGFNGSTIDGSQQVIDGTSTKIQGFFQIEIFNATTGQSGKAFLLTTGSPNDNTNALGWVFTTPVEAGDTINWLPTVNGAPNSEDWFAWGEIAYSEITVPVCFVRGTRILTPNGSVLIEDLKVGAQVQTLDHGPQTIRWIGSTTRAAIGKCAPIQICAGALENQSDLWVSQQHRMVLQSAKAEVFFGDNEVLASAKSLVNDGSIKIVEGGEVEYFHILFDQHEIIFAEGAMVESLHIGAQSLQSLPKDAIDEIEMLFPNLFTPTGGLNPTARQVLKTYEVRALLAA